MKTYSPNKGYIALISAILVSVSLLTLVVAVSFQGFISRFSVLESQQKEISAYLAESCINTAILEISQDEDYAGGVTVNVGAYTCDIVSVENGNIFASNRLIQAQGVHEEAYTNLEVEIDPSTPDFDIVAWNEVETLP